MAAISMATGNWIYLLTGTLEVFVLQPETLEHFFSFSISHLPIHPSQCRLFCFQDQQLVVASGKDLFWFH